MVLNSSTRLYPSTTLSFAHHLKTKEAARAASLTKDVVLEVEAEEAEAEVRVGVEAEAMIKTGGEIVMKTRWREIDADVTHWMDISLLQ
jgi:hypothetical protein